MLELAKLRGTKGTGSSSSTTEPIAAPPLSVAPAEGPKQGRKRKRLVKASTSLAAAAAAPSTEEESSGSPLIHRQRKLPAVEGASSLQPGEIEVVEVEEGSPPPPPTQPAPKPTCLPSPYQQPPPASQPSSPPQQANLLVHLLLLLGALLLIRGVSRHHCQSPLLLLNVVDPARDQALLELATRTLAGSSPWFDSSSATESSSNGTEMRWTCTWLSKWCSLWSFPPSTASK